MPTALQLEARGSQIAPHHSNTSLCTYRSGVHRQRLLQLLLLGYTLITRMYTVRSQRNDAATASTRIRSKGRAARSEVEEEQRGREVVRPQLGVELVAQHEANERGGQHTSQMMVVATTHVQMEEAVGQAAGLQALRETGRQLQMSERGGREPGRVQGKVEVHAEHQVSEVGRQHSLCDGMEGTLGPCTAAAGKMGAHLEAAAGAGSAAAGVSAQAATRPLSAPGRTPSRS